MRVILGSNNAKPMAMHYPAGPMRPKGKGRWQFKGNGGGKPTKDLGRGRGFGGGLVVEMDTQLVADGQVGEISVSRWSTTEEAEVRFTEVAQRRLHQAIAHMDPLPVAILHATRRLSRDCSDQEALVPLNPADCLGHVVRRSITDDHGGLIAPGERTAG